MTYRLEYTWPAFCVPTFNATIKLIAGVEDTVVVILIVCRPGQAVTEHTFSQGWKCIDWIRLQKAGSGGGIAFGGGFALRDTELIEFVFG